MTADILCLTLDGRDLGIPAMRVREVVRLPAITRVPGAPPMIAGVMNLRGQLVTAIDLRARLGLPRRAPGATAMAILTEHHDHVYAMIVDSVGDVMPRRADRLEQVPQTVSARWRAVALHVQLEEALVLVLDIDALLERPADSRAA